LTAGPLVIGVLAVQGDFAEHSAMLRRAALDAPDGPEVKVREVRTPLDLDNLDGLIVPGGESTTIGKLLVAYGL
jgi:5'-phosphate synthase pdxT subunit